LLGDAELTTMDQYVNEVSINQLGVVRVTKSFLPELRRRKGFSVMSRFVVITVFLLKLVTVVSCTQLCHVV